MRMSEKRLRRKGEEAEQTKLAAHDDVLGFHLNAKVGNKLANYFLYSSFNTQRARPLPPFSNRAITFNVSLNSMVA